MYIMDNQGQSRGSATRKPARSLGSVVQQVALHSGVLVLALLTIFPLLWMLSTAVKGQKEIFTPGIHLLPEHWTLQNFPEAFRVFPVADWFLNSAIIAGAITVGKLLVSIPAAYAFSILRFRGRGALFAIVLGTMIVPGVVTIVPNYVLVARLDWINTKQGVIVPELAHVGFYIFLLRQYMRALPEAMFDAARVDGAGPWTLLARMVIPNVRPAVAVITVLAFLSAWNLYLWPFLILNDLHAKTLAVGMQYFAANSESGQLWGPMMATATLATLPPLLLYALAQKRIISTFVTSGFKG